MSRKKNRPSNYLQCPEPYLMIPHNLILSKEYNELSANASKVYILLLTKWSRDKDKSEIEFEFTYNEILKILPISKSTLQCCIKELETKEFIYKTPGGYHIPNTYKPNTDWLVKGTRHGNSINKGLKVVPQK
jgi:hypothetical protein